MKITLESDQLAVFDDVLGADQLGELREFVHTLTMTPINPGIPLSPWQVNRWLARRSPHRRMPMPTCPRRNKPSNIRPPHR
ncbi:MAG: hypothetical protein MJE77_36145 [Proteobacteria bacterium]|nr:hypothetical protein [Pseudomonadota bacterium]